MLGVFYFVIGHRTPLILSACNESLSCATPSSHVESSSVEIVSNEAGAREFSPICPGNAIMITPKDDVQELIEANPPFTAFCLGKGYYENFDSIIPKEGNAFIGIEGALQTIVDGKRQYNFAFHQFFKPWEGRWANNVIIQGMTFQNYSTSKESSREDFADAVIEGHSGWVIEGNRIINNQGVAINLGNAAWSYADGGIVRDNVIANNAEGAVYINGADLEFAYNTVSANGYNRPPDDPVLFWIGNIKFTDNGLVWESAKEPVRDSTTGYFIHHNHILNNRGTGLWLDVYNQNAVIEYNRIEYNEQAGISDELNTGTRIAYNYVAYNAFEYETDWFITGAQIQIVNSEFTEVTENTVIASGKGNGIVIVSENNRRPQANNNLIYRNKIIQCSGFSGVDGDTSSELFYLSTNNKFDHNTYSVADINRSYWKWYKTLSWHGFRQMGQEEKGVLSNTSCDEE